MTVFLRVLFLILGFSCSVFSQGFTKDTYSIPVTANGELVDHPFTGGLYNPMHQFADIDADLDLDLFLYEPSDGRLSFFRNTGTRFEPEFSYERNPFPMPPAFGWFRFVDIDGDDRLDFLSSTIGGNALTIYQNNGTEQVPDFSLLTSALLDSAGAIVYSESFSLAACADMDADTDLDFLSLNSSAGTINYYENIGDASNFLLAFRTDRYQDIQICIGCGDAGGEARHGNGSMHFADMNADNDLDMLYGDLFHTGLYYFENVGTPQSAALDSITPWFPPDDPILTFGFNQPTLVDIDGDEDRDLFVSVLSSLVRKDNFRLYTNTGSTNDFFYELTDLNYLETVDFDLQSAPAFVDLDADNDQDLLVGNLDGSVALLRNTGSSTVPAFLLEDSTFVTGTGALVYVPEFVDIDDDGDKDMFLGHFIGKIEFYRNNGTPENPAFVRELWAFDTLSVGFYAAPSFFDADGDGDLDLFVGKSTGSISYYRNIGSPLVPRFVLETVSYAGIFVGGSSKPYFVDEDNDGDDDLLVGASDGLLRLYRNDGPPENPAFVLATSMYAGIDSVHECTLAMTDLDGDGDKDLMVGCQRGGLEFYRNDEVTSVPGGTDGGIPKQTTLFQNYPNPFNPKSEIGMRIAEAGWVTLRIYDLLGREVATLIDEGKEPGDYWVTWDAAGFPTGVYYYKVEARGNITKQVFTEVRKMVLVR